MSQINHKIDDLKDILSKLPSAAVAFSGGTDSTFLLHAYNNFFPERKLSAVTVSTDYMPSWEMTEAKEFCEERGISHKILVLPFPEEIRDNPEDRCYLCKRVVFNHIREYAAGAGIKAVIDGTNADDTREYRPGLRALSELGIISPLKEAGLTKEEIRSLSKEASLPTWNKPPYACLLTRIPYGVTIEKKNLKMIDMGEKLFASLGMAGVRVRMEGMNARIESTPDFFDTITEPATREIIIKELRKIGFRFISLDLEGYRTGSFLPKDKIRQNE